MACLGPVWGSKPPAGYRCALGSCASAETPSRRRRRWSRRLQASTARPPSGVTPVAISTAGETARLSTRALTWAASKHT